MNEASGSYGRGFRRLQNIRKSNERLIISLPCPRWNRDVLLIPELCPRGHFLQDLLLYLEGNEVPNSTEPWLHLGLCLHEKPVCPNVATVFFPFSIISGLGRKVRLIFKLLSKGIIPLLFG